MTTTGVWQGELAINRLKQNQEKTVLLWFSRRHLTFLMAFAILKIEKALSSNSTPWQDHNDGSAFGKIDRQLEILGGLFFVYNG